MVTSLERNDVFFSGLLSVDFEELVRERHGFRARIHERDRIKMFGREPQERGFKTLLDAGGVVVRKDEVGIELPLHRLFYLRIRVSGVRHEDARGEVDPRVAALVGDRKILRLVPRERNFVGGAGFVFPYPLIEHIAREGEIGLDAPECRANSLPAPHLPVRGHKRRLYVMASCLSSARFLLV